ncbi:MAG: RNA polymerase subunit sigma-24 [Sphingomonas sp.]|nr:RNA polymerase subunit sigma-24 [Sphingomonas sp.]
MIADPDTLGTLMAAAQRGDRAAYRALLVEAQRWLERYFHRRVPPGQRDDLVQEVLMAVHAKRATYDPARPFLPWLAAIARYRWVDHLRRAYRSEAAALDDHDASQDSDEEAVMARVSLERLFGQVPKKQARAIELVKIEGLTVAEAALRSGQSESAVKVNIHRGLKRLAALIEKAE